MSKNLTMLLVFIGIILFSGIFFRGCCTTFVDNHEFGYRFNLVTGSLDTLSRKGYFVHSPIIVKIHTIDTRPFQVCINANNRVLNCKLVQFNSKGFYEFINLHGRDDYSVTSNTNGTNGNLYEIMKSYAYEKSTLKGKSNYPFLTIIKEINDGESEFNIETAKDTIQ